MNLHQHIFGKAPNLAFNFHIDHNAHIAETPHLEGQSFASNPRRMEPKVDEFNLGSEAMDSDASMIQQDVILKDERTFLDTLQDQLMKCRWVIVRDQRMKAQLIMKIKQMHK